MAAPTSKPDIFLVSVCADAQEWIAKLCHPCCAMSKDAADGDTSGNAASAAGTSVDANAANGKILNSPRFFTSRINK